MGTENIRGDSVFPFDCCHWIEGWNRLRVYPCFYLYGEVINVLNPDAINVHYVVVETCLRNRHFDLSWPNIRHMSCCTLFQRSLQVWQNAVLTDHFAKEFLLYFTWPLPVTLLRVYGCQTKCPAHKIFRQLWHCMPLVLNKMWTLFLLKLTLYPPSIPFYAGIPMPSSHPLGPDPFCLW